MKITNDGFIWKILTERQAMAYLNEVDLGEIYLLMEDGTEVLAESNFDILEHGGQYGIEVGKMENYLDISEVALLHDLVVKQADKVENSEILNNYFKLSLKLFAIHKNQLKTN